jgi:cytochrome c biogenesis factor
MITIIWLIVGIKLLKTVQTNQKMAINKKKKRSFNRVSVRLTYFKTDQSRAC